MKFLVSFKDPHGSAASEIISGQEELYAFTRKFHGELHEIDDYLARLLEGSKDVKPTVGDTVSTGYIDITILPDSFTKGRQLLLNTNVKVKIQNLTEEDQKPRQKPVPAMYPASAVLPTLKTSNHPFGDLTVFMEKFIGSKYAYVAESATTRCLIRDLSKYLGPNMKIEVVTTDRVTGTPRFTLNFDPGCTAEYKDWTPGIQRILDDEVSYYCFDTTNAHQPACIPEELPSNGFYAYTHGGYSNIGYNGISQWTAVRSLAANHNQLMAILLQRLTKQSTDANIAVAFQQIIDGYNLSRRTDGTDCFISRPATNDEPDNVDGFVDIAQVYNVPGFGSAEEVLKNCFGYELLHTTEYKALLDVKTEILARLARHSQAVDRMFNTRKISGKRKLRLLGDAKVAAGKLPTWSFTND